jgi:hypothetical protein
MASFLTNIPFKVFLISWAILSFFCHSPQTIIILIRILNMYHQGLGSFSRTKAIKIDSPVFNSFNTALVGLLNIAKEHTMIYLAGLILKYEIIVNIENKPML